MTSPPKPRQYKNPPIEEALVEFRMVPTQEWDLTIPGKMHEKVKETYPGKPRQQRLLHASFRASPDLAAGFALQEGIGRVQLVDHEARKLLSLGPDVLSVNVLRPYDGWDPFRRRVESALRAYLNVSGSDRIGRIGVRYVNRIDRAVLRSDLGTHFQCWPTNHPGTDRSVRSFLYRTEYDVNNSIRLVVTFASIDMESTPSILLDLDAICEGTEPLAIDDALSVVDDLHSQVETTFEALVTDSTRETFDA